MVGENYFMPSNHCTLRKKSGLRGKGGKRVALGQAGMTKHYHFKACECQKRQFKGVLYSKSFQVMECKFRHFNKGIASS